MIGIGIGVPFQTSKGVAVYDSFNRANNALSMGNADTGRAWQALRGTWGIIDNRAYCAVLEGGTPSFSAIDAGFSDGVVISDIIFSTSESLVFRITDFSNNLFVQLQSSAVLLFRQQAGVNTQIGSYGTAITAGVSYKITVVLKGSSITVSLNDVVRITVTDAFNQTATLVGYRQGGSTTGRYDNLSVGVI